MAVTLNMTLIMACLTIATYNSHGLGSGRLEYINKLAEVNDFLFLQEHWMLSNQINTFGCKVSSMHVHGVSGMDEHELIQGRPYGGCLIMWKKSLVCKVTPVQIHSNRMCAVHVTGDGGLNVLLFNVYMPCDTEYDRANEEIYGDILHEISQVSENVDPLSILVGGDFNTDFRRSRSLHTMALLPFMVNESLRRGLDYQDKNVDYTYESKMNGDRSLIDHFLVTDNLFNNMKRYEVVHDGDNLSDHSVLCMVLDSVNLSYEHVTNEFTCKPRWSDASLENIQEYQHCLDAQLSPDLIPWEAINCVDYFCEKHGSEIQTFHDNIIHACLDASTMTIPKSKIRDHGKCVPGWNEHVCELRKQAIFWHRIWKDNNSPREGLLADIRRTTRSKYHCALREVKRNEDEIVANKMAESMLTNSTKSFWSDVRKLKGHSTRTPNNIDGATGSINIANLFSESYKELYNTVSYEEHDMSQLVKDMNADISRLCCGTGSGTCKYSHSVSVSECKLAIMHLKSGKHDGHTGHHSDHLIHGSHRLYTYISLLFSSMLKHGFTPDGYLMSTIVPIPKCKRKSLNDSSNYRGIALSSILGKAFDWIILTKYRDVLGSSDYQFGFKPGHSTTQCTYVAQETIQYYLNGGGSVHAILLDASKAFDRVHYVKLFRLLLKKGMCPLVARFLCAMYTNQKMCIKWENKNSMPFNVSNGVKQGGVLSPILFGIYIDELLSRLKTAGYGCHIGNVFVGALGYADDIVLLVPTIAAANKMLEVVRTFSLQYNVKFNPDKSKHVFFGKNGPTRSCLVLAGADIELCKHSIHLGVPFGENIGELQMTQLIADFTKRVNCTIGTFGKAHSEVKYKLFKAYCMSLYGCSLWDLSSKHVDRFYVAWRKSIRRLLLLPARTHNALLPIICNDKSVDAQVHSRFVSFMCAVLNSSNQCVRICGQLSLGGSRSNVCNSINYVCQKYKVNKYSLSQTGAVRACISAHAETVNSRGDLITAGCVKDLIVLREQHNTAFTSTEINQLITFLCTS